MKMSKKPVLFLFTILILVSFFGCSKQLLNPLASKELSNSQSTAKSLSTPFPYGPVVKIQEFENNYDVLVGTANDAPNSDAHEYDTVAFGFAAGDMIRYTLNFANAVQDAELTIGYLYYGNYGDLGYRNQYEVLIDGVSKGKIKTSPTPLFPCPRDMYQRVILGSISPGIHSIDFKALNDKPFNLDLFYISEAAPVAFWKFEENSQTIYDSSGNENNGTNCGPVNAVGISGNGLSFDGVNDFLLCFDHNGLNITKDITIDAWIKVGPSPYNMYIVQKFSPNYPYSGYALMAAQNGTLGFWYGSPAQGFKYSDTQNKLNDNQWHHVVVSANASAHTGVFYIDDVQDGSFEWTGEIADNSAEYLYIGSYRDGVQQVLNGCIDEVKIFDYVRQR